jgi:cytochrome c-type biogenesis protein CcmH
LSRRPLTPTPKDEVLDGAPDRVGEGAGEVGRRGGRAPWWPWIVLACVVGGALVLGALGERPPATGVERVNAVARTIRCPTCQGESVAQSEAEISKEIRLDIARRLEAGEAEDQIRASYVARYGEGIVLDPSGSGIAGLVWALPVIAGVLAVAGLVAVFRRWHADAHRHATAADEELVAAALQPAPAADGDEPDGEEGS